MRDDVRFDQVVESMLDQMPANALPPPVQVTPWRRAMGLVLWGIGLTCLNVQLWYLAYILPAIGGILLVLGFRTLRRENDWLRSCWRLSIALAAVRGVSTVAMATILPHLAPWVENAFGWLLGILSWLLYMGLWRGMLAIGRKAGQEQPSARAAGALVLWYTALMAASMFAAAIQGLAAWVMLALYIIILRRLTKLTRALDDCGYAVQAAPVRWDGRWVAAAYLGLVALGVALGLLLGQRLPMDWTLREPSAQQVQTVRDRLEDLGLPRELVDDLADADVLSLSGVQQIKWYRQAEYENDGGTIHLWRAAALVPGGDDLDRWAILAYFRYEDGVSPGYTDGMSLQPWSQDKSPVPEEPGSGYVLCDRADGTYMAPMRRLTWGRWQQTRQDTASLWMSQLFGDSGCPYLYGEWSSPRQGQRVRGYLLGWRQSAPPMEGEELFFNDQVVLYRQSAPCYPGATALDMQGMADTVECHWFGSMWVIQEHDGTFIIKKH